MQEQQEEEEEELQPSPVRAASKLTKSPSKISQRLSQISAPPQLNDEEDVEEPANESEEELESLPEPEPSSDDVDMVS